MNRYFYFNTCHLNPVWYSGGSCRFGRVVVMNPFRISTYPLSYKPTSWGFSRNLPYYYYCTEAALFGLMFPLVTVPYSITCIATVFRNFPLTFITGDVGILNPFLWHSKNILYRTTSTNWRSWFILQFCCVDIVHWLHVKKVLLYQFGL